MEDVYKRQAQSIGEPGTQLTLRTFHAGGTAANIAANASICLLYTSRCV